MAFSYVVTSQKSTAVNHSLICNFTSSDERNLILARGNHIEIHKFHEDGLVAEYDLSLFGNILSLDKFRPASQTKDVLFVLTDKKHFSVLSFDVKSKKVITDAVGNVKDKVGKETECGQRGFIDPDNRMIGMQLYDGLLKLVPNDAAGLREAFNVPLEETRVLDIKFLHGCPSRPTLCMLYEDARKCRHVKTLCVDLREKELVPGPWSQSNVEFASSMIITVPAPLGGVILVGAMSLTYISGTGNMQSVEISVTQISAYAPINADGTRYLLGDHRGNLIVLVLCTDHNNKVVSMVVDSLGITSIAKTLNYLDNGVVFVGSVFGDSQLIKLHPPSDASCDSNNNCFDVLDTYVNISPIVDMCLVDSDKQNASGGGSGGGGGGQRQLVTCSGAYKDGSLRIVRSGIGILEQASLEVTGIKGTWSLRPSENSQFDKYLVQSFVGETRILGIEDEELAEIEFEGFNSQLPTLYCGNTIDTTMVQVTGVSVRLVDCVSFALIDEYVPNRSITVASGNLIQIAVALSGGELIYLEIVNRQLVVQTSVTLDQDIACLSLRPVDAAGIATTGSGDDEMDLESSVVQDGLDKSHLKSNIVAVGLWTDNSARLLALPTLDELCRVSLGTDTQVRDILMVRLDDKVFLMLGVGDGHLITYSVQITSHGLPSLANKRKGVLGTHSISFSCFLNAGELCVFASCDRPTVIYCRNGKLLFSAVNSNNSEIIGMTPFHSELFPSCLAMISECALTIGTIEDIQKIHIQTVPLNEAPRRICHNISTGVYAVCTEKTTSTERGDETVSRVLFLEDGAFEMIGTYELDPLEQAISCVSGIFEQATTSSDSSSSSAQTSSVEYIIVGTARVINEEFEPSRGRILVFEVTNDRRIHLVTEKETTAAVFSMVMLQGKLAAGLGSKVQMYSLTIPEFGNNFPDQPELRAECSHTGFIMCLYLKAHGDRLLVGDMVRSMAVLQYRDGALEEVGRDFNTSYMLAVEVLEGGENFLGCDDCGNLFVVHQQTDAVTDEERCRLETRGEFCLGDFVNVFRRGSLVGQPIESADNAIVSTSHEGESGSNSAVGSDGKKSFQLSSSQGGGGGVASIVDNNYQTVTGYPPNTDSVLYGTVGGAVGCVIPLSEDSFRFFAAIERAMVHMTTPIGGLTHADWRSFSNGIRSGAQRNMVDGNLVEMFLDLAADDLEVVVRDVNDSLNSYITALNTHGKGTAGVNTESVGPMMQNLSSEKIQLSVEDVVRRVEDIARLH